MLLQTLKSLIFLGLFVLGSAAQTPLSLADATSRALSQNRDVLAAKLAIQVKQNEALAAQTRRWPSLSTQAQVGPLLNRATLTFTQGALGNFPATGPIPANDVNIEIPRRIGGLGISQAAMPLSQQYRIGVNIKEAREETEAAKAQSDEVKLATAARVRTLYFQLVSLQAAKEAAGSQMKTAEEVARLAHEGVAKGVALPADESAAQARLAQANADVANIAADMTDGAQQLNLLMGEPLDAQFSLMASVQEQAPLSEQEAGERALAARPDLKEARIRLEQAGLSVRSKQLEQIPDVSLAVSYVYFLNTNNFLPSQLLMAGLNLTWEPWDWGRRRREAEALKGREEQQRLMVKQSEERVAYEARHAWREYERAGRELAVARAATQSAAERLRVAKERYAKQAALLREVFEAESAWETAGQTEARALAASGAAWANLQSALGVE